MNDLDPVKTRDELKYTLEVLAKFFTLFFFRSLVGCAKSDPAKPFDGNGLTTAVYTQEQGFIDVAICQVDIHLVGNIVYVSGGNPVSHTDNSQYVAASDGLFDFPSGGPQNQDCKFRVLNGLLANP